MALALVTGAAKRIGREIAIALAKQGFDLILHYNSSETEIVAVQQVVEEMGRHASLLQADFAKIETLEAKLQGVEKADLLINSASIFENDEISTFNHDKITKHFNVNCLAPMLLSQAFAANKQTINRNIINILDYNVIKVPSDFTSYNVSKASLAYFTKIAALQLAPIRVNGIALGHALCNDRQSQENFEDLVNKTPLGASVQIQDITNTIRYIIDTHALTGHIIMLDSGANL